MKGLAKYVAIALLTIACATFVLVAMTLREMYRIDVSIATNDIERQFLKDEQEKREHEIVLTRLALVSGAALSIAGIVLIVTRKNERNDS
jgi:hypothetical protein